MSLSLCSCGFCTPPVKQSTQQSLPNLRNRTAVHPAPYPALATDTAPWDPPFAPAEGVAGGDGNRSCGLAVCESGVDVRTCTAASVSPQGPRSTAVGIAEDGTALAESACGRQAVTLSPFYPGSRRTRCAEQEVR